MIEYLGLHEVKERDPMFVGGVESRGAVQCSSREEDDAGG